MPIRILGNAEVQSWEVLPGVVIRYRQAKSGDALRAIRRMADAATGQIDAIGADQAVVAAHVEGWEGIEGADGKPIEWPADPEMRIKLLDELPWWLFAGLRSRVTEAAAASAESGKDSTQS